MTSVTAALARLQVRLARLVARLLLPRGSYAPVTALADVQRIVVLKLDELGDVVLVTPFLRELRRAAPRAHVTVVAQAAAADLLARSPYVDAVLVHRTTCRRALRPFVLPWRAAVLGYRRLRPLDPQLALVPRWDGDYWYATFAALLSGAPARVGFAERATPRKRVVNAGYDALLTRVVEGGPLVHEADRSLDLLRALGAMPVAGEPEVWWEEAEERFAREAIGHAAADAASPPVVALCPSFGHSRLKQWPADHFVAIGRRLLAAGARVVLVGGPGDRALAGELRAALGDEPTDLTGRTTVPQLAALLARCALFVGADTGVLHVATAAGTPAVGLYGPTNVARFGARRARLATLDLPCSPVHRAPELDRCAPCVLGEPRCMLDLGVEQVWREIARALPGAAPATAPGGTADGRRGAAEAPRAPLP